MVCSDWFELTKYEMFWVATMKSCIQTQLKICNEEESTELEDALMDWPRYLDLVMYSKDEILKERKAYVRSLESTNKILLVNMAPFKKRKETNDDIYGSTCKQRTVQFIKQRSKRRVSLEIAKQLIKISNLFATNDLSIEDKMQLFQKKWRLLKEFTDNHPLYDRVAINGIPTMGQKRFLINHFCMHYIVLLNICVNISPFENTEDFFIEMTHYFLVECECSLIPVVEDIIKLGHCELFLDETDPPFENVKVLTPFLFPKFANEVAQSTNGGVSKSTFINVLVGCCNVDEAVDFLVFSKFIKVLKGKKGIDFEKSLMESLEEHGSYLFFSGSIEVARLFLRDMGAAKQPTFNPQAYSSAFLRRQFRYQNQITGSETIELLKQVKTEFGISFSHPEALYIVFDCAKANQGRLEVMKYLVEEEHVDVNQCFGTHSSPLALCVHCSNLSDNSKEILYLIEKGATITPEQIGTYEEMVYEHILDYYIARDQKTYLPIIKQLHKMVSGTLNGNDFLSEMANGYINNCTTETTLEILDYIAEYSPIDQGILNKLFQEWERIFPLHEDKNVFKQLILDKY